MKSFSKMLYEKKDGIATMTLNCPEKLNALDWPMRLEMSEIIDDVGCDNSVSVLIITGAGRGFCSGADVGGQLTRAEGKETNVDLSQPVGGMSLTLRRLEKPIIAAVNGIAVGAGLSLALHCDLRIVSEEARFGLLFSQVGLCPDSGMSYALPRLVGIGKALELMFLNEVINAKEAERIGLVNRVVPAGDLMKVTTEIATRISKLPPLAIRLTKQVAYLGLTNDLNVQLRVESDALQRCVKSPEHMAAVQAFLERRQKLPKSGTNA